MTRNNYIAIVGPPEFNNLTAVRDYVKQLDPSAVVVCSDGEAFDAKVRQVASSVGRAMMVIPRERQRYGDVSFMRCAERIVEQAETLAVFSAGTYGLFLYHFALAEEAGRRIDVIGKNRRSGSIEALRMLAANYRIAEDINVGRARATGEATAQARPGIVKVDFHRTDVGWLLFSVIHDEKVVRISAECYHDPFPDMIRWLEAIANDALPAHFEVGTWGRGTHRFTATPVDQEMFRFLLSAFDEDSPAEYAETWNYVDCDVDKLSFVREFYGQFRAYIASRHDPGQWMTRTYVSLVRTIRPGFRVSHLQRMNHEDLRTFWRECIERLPIRSPRHWRSWKEAELRDYITDALEDELTRWGGRDLTALVSPKLEALLDQ